MPERRVVAGGSVASLAAADALARAGRDVLLVLPERGTGGGFLGMPHGGRRLELGARLLELSYGEGAADAPLSAYVPSAAGHRPHVGHVAAWAADLVGADRLVEVERPRLCLDGALHPDVHFTVDLRGVDRALGPDRARRVAAEAQAARAGAGDAGVLDPARAADLEDMDLETASLANHGPTLHAALIAGLAAKFCPGGPRRALATARRKVWMPLFWPRTVAEACAGLTPAFVPHRPLHTVAWGGPGELVRALLARVQASPRIEVVTAGPLQAIAAVAGGATELRFTGLGPLRAVRPVLGVAARELYAAAGIAYAPERVRSVLAWVAVGEDDLLDDPSLVHVADAANPIGRVSAGPPEHGGRRVLAIELRHDLPAEQAEAAAVAALPATGLVGPDAVLEPLTSAALPTYELPGAENRDAAAAARVAWDGLSIDAELTGAALAPGADALNEQVVQALRIAERAA